MLKVNMTVGCSRTCSADYWSIEPSGALHLWNEDDDGPEETVLLVAAGMWHDLEALPKDEWPEEDE